MSEVSFLGSAPPSARTGEIFSVLVSRSLVAFGLSRTRIFEARAYTSRCHREERQLRPRQLRRRQPKNRQLPRRRPFHANHAPLEDRQDDPLAQILQPPPDESPEDRQRRETAQREATRVSLEIDDRIQEDRKAYERRKKAVKILLLGASPAPCARGPPLSAAQARPSPARARH